MVVSIFIASSVNSFAPAATCSSAATLAGPLSGAGAAPYPVARPASGVGQRHHDDLRAVDGDIVEKIREARDTKPAETGSEGRALIRDGRYPLDRLIDRISERLGDPWAPPRIPAEGFEILLRGQTVEEDIHIRWALRSGLLLQLRP